MAYLGGFLASDRTLRLYCVSDGEDVEFFAVAPFKSPIEANPPRHMYDKGRFRYCRE